MSRLHIVPQADYDSSKSFKSGIQELIRHTHATEDSYKVIPQGKRFATRIDDSFFHMYEKDRATSSDTIGTKGLIYWEMGAMKEAAKCAVAMVVDDLIEHGNTTIELHDVIVMPHEDTKKLLQFVEGFVEICVENKWAGMAQLNPIIITGGETVQTSMSNALEVAMFGTGYILHGHRVDPNIKEGDVLIGLGSNGIHSNGTSFFISELLDKRKMDMSSNLPWGVTFGEEFTRPTHIYLPAIQEMTNKIMDNYNDFANIFIHGMVHVTGTGLKKLKDELILPRKDVDIVINRAHPLEPQELFFFANRDLGVSAENMYSRFNNGIGFVIVVERHTAMFALSVLKKHFPAEIIGEVRSGTGKLVIESKYDDSISVY